jgi:hypothetical protein
MPTIPSKEELRAAGAALEQHSDEQQAEQIRALVVRELRQAVDQVYEWITDQPQWQTGGHALRGAIADAMATGLEIGLLINQGRAELLKQREES